MTEVEKLHLDLLRQDREMRREGWQLVFAAIGGAGATFAAAWAFLRVTAC